MADEPDRSAVREILTWLVDAALEEASLEAMIEGLANRIRAADIPVWRVTMAFADLHPLYYGRIVSWVRGQGLLKEVRSRASREPDATWYASPWYVMTVQDLHTMRRRLTSGGLEEFPILVDLRERGGTDYSAFRVHLGATDGSDRHDRPDGIVGSWTTDAPEGWRESDLAALRDIERVFALAAYLRISRDTTRNILAAYLGPASGDRVLAGTIRRGDHSSIRAVIWFSDLRGSTPMAEQLEPGEFFTTLNHYFESTAGAVMEHGGEILRYIGDATLAIFPTEPDGVQSACERALAAARAAATRAHALNVEREAAGLPVLGHGIGLHLGEVLYGNIGTPTRIEFSVVGPAANLAARIEGLTRTLGETVVVSAEFARHLDEPWRSLGRHDLRGVVDPVEVLAPPPTAD